MREAEAVCELNMIERCLMLLDEKCKNLLTEREQNMRETLNFGIQIHFTENGLVFQGYDFAQLTGLKYEYSVLYIR